MPNSTSLKEVLVKLQLELKAASYTLPTPSVIPLPPALPICKPQIS